MSPLCTLETAFANLRAHKLRTMLTMLGISIGVAAVIVMVSLMEGARTQMVREFERLGSRLILVLYDPDLAQKKQAAHPLEGMTMDDVRALRSKCSLVGELCAEVQVGVDATASYQGREAKVRHSGVEPEYEHLRAVTVARGRFISRRD